MSLESYLRAAPKAELHVHLEGSISPATLLTLARRNRVDLPADTVEGLKRWFHFPDFGHFVEIYTTLSRCLQTLEDYEQITYQFGEEMARQNTRYAEVTFSPSTHLLNGVRGDSFFTGLWRGREWARKDFGVEINWVLDIVRGSPCADYTTAMAIEGRDEGVVALGLSGPEDCCPPELFAPEFQRARAAGLPCVPHAGEMSGPSSVWGVLRALGPERIDHGVRSIEDPKLVAYLARERIALDLCPTSNVRLGVYPRLADHPLPRLHQAGVIVTVNSDDPPLFDTTLSDEVLKLSSVFGFDVDTLDEILLNGVGQSFLPPERKQELEGAFRAEMAALKRVHLAGALPR